MPEDVPPAPSEIPNDIASRLQAQPADRLRRIATYAEELADAKHQAQPDPDDRDIDADAEDVEKPDADSVPKRATKTQKTINGNDYWYWQWREGDQIKSEYIEPVSPDN